MKRLTLFFLTFFIFLGVNSAFAKNDLSVDGNLFYASDPSDGYGGAFGFGVGVNYDLSQKVYKNLHARFDFSYHNHSETFNFAGVGSTDFSFRRIPLFLGAQYFHPLKNKVFLLAELGLEISFDKFEAGIPDFFTGSIIVTETSETNFGVTPGVGIVYDFNKTVSGGVKFRYHIITGDYWTFGVFVSKKFSV